MSSQNWKKNVWKTRLKFQIKFYTRIVESDLFKFIQKSQVKKTKL